MTTIWDNIYKNHQNGGEAWASLSEGIHPLFKNFLKETKFDKYQVLDIGCGHGKYLKLSQAVGFKTDGIDSSETAMQIIKKNLADDSLILCEVMFAYEIP